MAKYKVDDAELRKLRERGLNPLDCKYLSERGILVKQGWPLDLRDQEPVLSKPYLILSGRKNAPPLDETYPRPIMQKIERNNWVTGDMHPKRGFETRDLILVIENIIAARRLDEGRIIDTKPGEPIRVFVADSSWNEVASILTEKYPVRTAS